LGTNGVTQKCPEAGVVTFVLVNGPHPPATGSSLAVATALTSVSDGIFATALAVLMSHSTFARTWQGVASVPLGREAFQGGITSVVIGLAIHVFVAFTWSAIFLFGWMRLRSVRPLLLSRWGALKVAFLYGPAIWLVMSLVVIPLFTRRLPTINLRWWILFAGHAPFVGLPIAWAAKNAIASRSARPAL
jgi:hypothetical protein